MSEVPFLNNRNFITSNDAALRCGFSTEYVAKLCREGKIQGNLIGRSWYIDEDSLVDFLVLKDTAIAPEGYISTSESAKRYGCTTEYISKLCRENKLKGFLVGRSWFVDPESLVLCMQAREQAKIASAQKLSEVRRNELSAHEDARAIRLSPQENYPAYFSIAPLVPMVLTHKKLFPKDSGYILLEKAFTGLCAIAVTFGLFATLTSAYPRDAYQALASVFQGTNVLSEIAPSKMVSSRALEFTAALASAGYVQSDFSALPSAGEGSTWSIALLNVKNAVNAFFGKDAPIEVKTVSKVTHGSLATAVPPPLFNPTIIISTIPSASASQAQTIEPVLQEPVKPVQVKTIPPPTLQKKTITDRLCLTDKAGQTCVTKTQLDALLAGTRSTSSTLDVIGPVITINGANPAKANIGDVYNDLGATATDNVNSNLSISATLDGVLIDPNSISIDTSVSGKHIIIYSAVDAAGNVESAIRIVHVGTSTPSGP